MWFDIAPFSAPPSATFGNTGRNILSGPGLVNLDASLFRKFNVNERFTLEFRAEAYNLSNTPHFDNPNTTFGNAGFGQVTTARGTETSARNDARQFEFALRLQF